MSSADVISPPPAQPRVKWRLNAVLFALTVFSTFLAGAWRVLLEHNEDPSFSEVLSAWSSGWVFAVPLLAILLCHEFGHFIAARLHHVQATLPYFLPLPMMETFGTLGAVIAMPPRLPSRRALLDIGAAGPIAGMLVAVPMMVIGLSLSPVEALPEGGYQREGQSLFYLLMKRLVVGPIPEGYDVWLHPTALAAWVGFFITMLNLLPWGQLDGGHIAYALFGERQDRYARWVRLALLPLFLFNLGRFSFGWIGTSQLELSFAVINSTLPIMWFIMTGILGYFFGSSHPPVSGPPLDSMRSKVAVGCLALFGLLFMPTFMEQYPLLSP